MWIDRKLQIINVLEKGNSTQSHQLRIFLNNKKKEIRFCEYMFFISMKKIASCKKKRS